MGQPPVCSASKAMVAARQAARTLAGRPPLFPRVTLIRLVGRTPQQSRPTSADADRAGQPPPAPFARNGASPSTSNHFNASSSAAFVSRIAAASAPGRHGETDQVWEKPGKSPCNSDFARFGNDKPLKTRDSGAPYGSRTRLFRLKI